MKNCRFSMKSPANVPRAVHPERVGVHGFANNPMLPGPTVKLRPSIFIKKQIEGKTNICIMFILGKGTNNNFAYRPEQP